MRNLNCICVTLKTLNLGGDPSCVQWRSFIIKSALLVAVKNANSSSSSSMPVVVVVRLVDLIINVFLSCAIVYLSFSVDSSTRIVS